MVKGRKRGAPHPDEEDIAGHTSGRLQCDASSTLASNLRIAISQPRLVRRRLGVLQPPPPDAPTPLDGLPPDATPPSACPPQPDTTPPEDGPPAYERASAATCDPRLHVVLRQPC